MCGMSVVGAEWETLKRFNLAELYQPASTSMPQAKVQAESKPEEAKTDETRLAEDTQAGTGSAVP
jgi:tRNA acetyltransferase TAN1